LQDLFSQSLARTFPRLALTLLSVIAGPSIYNSVVPRRVRGHGGVGYRKGKRGGGVRGKIQRKYLLANFMESKKSLKFSNFQGQSTYIHISLIYVYELQIY